MQIISILFMTDLKINYDDAVKILNDTHKHVDNDCKLLFDNLQFLLGCQYFLDIRGNISIMDINDLKIFNEFKLDDVIKTKINSSETREIAFDIFDSYFQPFSVDNAINIIIHIYKNIVQKQLLNKRPSLAMIEKTQKFTDMIFEKTKEMIVNDINKSMEELSIFNKCLDILDTKKPTRKPTPSDLRLYESMKLDDIVSSKFKKNMNTMNFAFQTLNQYCSTIEKERKGSILANIYLSIILTEKN